MYSQYWPKGRTAKGGRREKCHGDSSCRGVPEVCQRAAHDSQRRASKNTDEEPAYHDRLEVLRHRNRDLEDGKDRVTEKQRRHPAV